MMNNNTPGKWIFGAVIASSTGMAGLAAAEAPAGIVGKSDWLFYRHEISDTTDMAATGTSIDLIQRVNKVLSANGISMAVAMVPLKMRIYSEFLPDDVRVNDYMKGNYERMSKVLQAAHVNIIDLNTAFMTSPQRASATPLYYRLDTHWTPVGAMVAAQAVKAALDAHSALKKVLDALPEEKFEMTNLRRQTSRRRDLTDQLPPDSPIMAFEQVTPIKVSRPQTAKQDLLGNAPALGLTLMGSSYSSAWTGFQDALRFALQREFLSVSVGADQGSWVGLESYLRDDAFQTQPPKLMIWEMPERDMRAPPDYMYREARYASNNTEWLLRVSALVQRSCKASAVGARLAPLGLAANAANLRGSDLAVAATNDSDFVEIGFDKPVEKLDYLSAQATSAGAKTLTLEASGPGVATRRFTLAVPGDDAAHALKTPLFSTGSGFTKVRIYPGKSNGFSLQGLKVCRQPEELLS